MVHSIALWLSITGLLLNVSLLLSAPVDNIWLGDLRDRTHWTSTGTLCLACCFMCVCMRVSACSYPYICASCHACMQPSDITPDMRLHVRSTSSGLSVPASRTCRWNRILTQCKLACISNPTSLHFPSVSDIECVVMARHGAVDWRKKCACRMWSAVQRLVR